MAKKYRWSFSHYDAFSRLAVALTNFHIARYPLRREDAQFYARVKARLQEISETAQKKRKRSERAYRMNREARLGQRMYVPHQHLDDAVFAPQERN